MAETIKSYTNVVDVAGAQWSADTLTVSPGDGTVRIVNADPYRRSCTIYTDPDSAGVLYLVPNAGQKRGGVRLIPGAGFNFEHGAEVHARAEGGAVLVNMVSETGAAC